MFSHLFCVCVPWWFHSLFCFFFVLLLLMLLWSFIWFGSFSLHKRKEVINKAKTQLCVRRLWHFGVIADASSVIVLYNVLYVWNVILSLWLSLCAIPSARMNPVKLFHDGMNTFALKQGHRLQSSKYDRENWQKMEKKKKKLKKSPRKNSPNQK